MKKSNLLRSTVAGLAFILSACGGGGGGGGGGTTPTPTPTPDITLEQAVDKRVELGLPPTTMGGHVSFASETHVLLDIPDSYNALIYTDRFAELLATGVDENGQSHTKQDYLDFFARIVDYQLANDEVSDSRPAYGVAFDWAERKVRFYLDTLVGERAPWFQLPQVSMDSLKEEVLRPVLTLAYHHNVDQGWIGTYNEDNGEQVSQEVFE